MNTAKRFSKKVVIITGGAKGIGKSAVSEFTIEGAQVVLWDMDEENGLKCESEFGRMGLDIKFQKVNTCNLEEVETAAAKIFSKFGRIDILINNAGVTKDATQLNMTEEQWQQVIDVNLTGVSICTKVISPFMQQNKFGRIINIVSLVGIYGNIGQTNYSATKAGVVSITKVWARELSKYGITVNAIAPGIIETESTKAVPEKVIKSIKERIPVGRLGRASDITNAYLFLASDEASYISGSVLSVDGGFMA